MPKLPEPTLYTLELLSKKWGCDESVILNYGVTGQLKISVISHRWPVKEGVGYPKGEKFIIESEKSRLSSREIFRLSQSSILELRRDGESKNTVFVHENKNSYLMLDGGIVSLNIKDLVIQYKHANELEAEQRLININKGEYVSPYMELMHQAIIEFNINTDNQSKKTLIEEWFLGKKIGNHTISKNEADKLASFIRYPSKGGNTPLSGSKG